MNALITEGLTDAVGFVGGSLLALWLARLTGFDPFTGAMDGIAMVGILACGIGGGAGSGCTIPVHNARDAGIVTFVEDN